MHSAHKSKTVMAIGVRNVGKEIQLYFITAYQDKKIIGYFYFTYKCAGEKQFIESILKHDCQPLGTDFLNT